MKRILNIIILLIAAFTTLPSQAQIGTWKNYLAYHDITWAEHGSHTLFVLASNDLFTYNERDKSITTWDRVNGLNDTGIKFIAWCQQAHRLVIVYESGNIDLMDEDGNITNLADYYNKMMTVDKTIYGIDIHGSNAYLSTAFGLVKIDVANAAISDTYNLGYRINYCYLDNEYIYAGVPSSGMVRARLTDNLLDKNNWKLFSPVYKIRNKTADAEHIAEAKTLKPGGPKYNYFGFMKMVNNKLYTSGGGGGYVERNRKGTIQVLQSDGSWNIYQDNLADITGHRYIDVMTVAVDPADTSHVFAGGRTGVYEFRSGRFVNAYNIDNTNGVLQAAAGANNNKDYVIVNSLIYDSKGVLWGFNGTAPSTTLFEVTRDGQWTAHNISNMMFDTFSLQNVVSMMFDRNGILWFSNNHWNKNCIAMYDPSSESSEVYESFTNEDGTKFDAWYNTCNAEDKQGNIWLGTNIGPLYIAAEDIGKSAEEMIFQQYKVPRNDGTNLADYLLDGVNISSIAIDRGNRKWFGTNGDGVYCISGDNNTQVHHFLANNSHLLSDNVESIAIDDKTGEVFIGTDKGLCSYVSDATTIVDHMDKDNTYAYPNPVRPGYSGPITIVGLTSNASVKIATTNGVLVAEGTAQNGRFVWDGNDRSGKRVASGIYMVETADEEGSNGVVCKVAVIN